jgi:hypothetical protein
VLKLGAKVMRIRNVVRHSRAVQPELAPSQVASPEKLKNARTGRGEDDPCTRPVSAWKRSASSETLLAEGQRGGTA